MSDCKTAVFFKQTETVRLGYIVVLRIYAAQQDELSFLFSISVPLEIASYCFKYFYFSWGGVVLFQLLELEKNKRTHAAKTLSCFLFVLKTCTSITGNPFLLPLYFYIPFPVPCSLFPVCPSFFELLITLLTPGRRLEDVLDQNKNKV